MSATEESHSHSNMSKSQHQTPFYGKNTGHPFSIYPKNGSSTVKALEVWSGWGSGDAEKFWVVKGIKLTWFDGEQKQVYHHPKDSDTYASYEFGPDETADWSVRAGWRIVRLEFETSAGNIFNVGGDSGTLHQHVARGSLVGFEGSSGWEIDYLSLRYKTD